MAAENNEGWTKVGSSKPSAKIPIMEHIKDLQRNIKSLFVSIPVKRGIQIESYQFSDNIEFNIFSGGEEQFIDPQTRTTYSREVELYRDFLQFCHDKITILQNELKTNIKYHLFRIMNETNGKECLLNLVNDD